LKRAEKEFTKARLVIVYVQGETLPFIQIADQVRWAQVSSINKVNEGLPITTSSIEAINGHCHEVTPHRNSFWASMIRIAKMIDRGIEYFPYSMRHNFNAAPGRAADFVHIIGEREMNRQRLFYCTNMEKAICSCVASSYLSGAFGYLVSCCHLFHSGLRRSILPKSPSLIHSTGPYFVLVLESAERAGEESSHERKDALLGMAAYAIKNLSKMGAKLDNL
jgi:hypothetical protein